MSRTSSVATKVKFLLSRKPFDRALDERDGDKSEAVRGDGQGILARSDAGISMEGTWLPTSVATIAILLLYMPLFPDLIREWASFPSLSHGFAVPLIAGYLIWTRRQQIANTTAIPSWPWLPLVMVSLALFVAGTRGGEPFLARVSLPITLLGGIALISGWTVAGQMMAGITYLFFMIPLPYVTLKVLTDQMRLFDAGVTAGILSWIGVPVLQEGYFLHLPNMTLEVADVCSSIPAIVSFLALAAAYGYVNRRRPMAVAILILSAVPFGILSNIIRITVTAAGVYIIGPIAIHNVIHMWNGLTVFLMTLALLIALDAALQRIWGKTGDANPESV
jgi:exosortase